MKTSEMINEISKAMANAQGEMQPALKSANNPFFKSRYADFASVWEAIREPLKKNELSIWQDVTNSDHGICVSTRVTHSSGQWVEFGPLEIPIPKKDAQSVGSAISYAKRYSLSAAVGVVSDIDDDGEKAMGRDEKKKDAVPRKIGKSEWTELNHLIEKCSTEFQQKVWDGLNGLGIQSLADMDEETFTKIKTACLGHISKQHKSKNEDS